MSEIQQNNQQPSNNQMNQPPANWNMPTMNPMMNPAMMQMWTMNPWLAMSMTQPRNQMMGGPNQGGMQQEIQNNQPVQNGNQNSEPSKPANNRVVISCGIVENQQEIRPADIPMDDGFGMFMRKDLEEIYIKQWGNDGKINTRKYIPVEEPEPQTDSDISVKDILDQTNARFERIEEAIVSLSQSIGAGQNRKQPNNQKKDGGNN